MRPDQMALWNELLPSIGERIIPTTSSHIPTTSKEPDDKKGTAMKRKNYTYRIFSIKRPRRLFEVEL